MSATESFEGQALADFPGVSALLTEIVGVGTDRALGGWSRHVFDDSERQLRAWFLEHATALGLDTETDRNGNLWAWWGTPGPDAVVTGSHLDSVPGGGAFDGPLGVASALAAVAALRREGFSPSRPFAVAVFAEEEGSRFGIACLGSRLLTGAIDPARAAALTDSNGCSFGEMAKKAGIDITHLGRDAATLSRIGVFVELHIEQGRGLIDLDQPVGLASSILAHGRWRLRFCGQGNHAGTTPMTDRHDPMVASAMAILASREIAQSKSGVRATVGRIQPIPGGTNVIASEVNVWLDVRGTGTAPEDAVIEISRIADAAARREGCFLEVIEESYSPQVIFDPVLRDRLGSTLSNIPQLGTGAGHDAGILAGYVPTAMLFVRNPSGISHSPEEWANEDDCQHGVDALVAALKELL